MNAPEMLPADMQTLVEDAYRAGFVAASRWANRNDLLSDTDSPAYCKERDIWLQKRLQPHEGLKKSSGSENRI